MCCSVARTAADALEDEVSLLLGEYRLQLFSGSALSLLLLASDLRLVGFRKLAEKSDWLVLGSFTSLDRVTGGEERRGVKVNLQHFSDSSDSTRNIKTFWVQSFYISAIN